jgi:hypothetical protein
VKIVMLSAGGGVLVAGVALAALDALATAVSNYRPLAFLAPEASSGQMGPQAQTSDWPWMVVGLGAATLMGGAVISSDPLSLTDQQRRALYQGAAAPPPEPERAPRQDRSLGVGLQFSLVPAARGEGGSLILGGRF